MAEKIPRTATTFNFPNSRPCVQPSSVVPFSLIHSTHIECALSIIQLSQDKLIFKSSKIKEVGDPCGMKKKLKQSGIINIRQKTKKKKKKKTKKK